MMLDMAKKDCSSILVVLLLQEYLPLGKYIPYIRKIAGKEDYADVRNVMIMGGSRIAVRTAQYVPDYMGVSEGSFSKLTFWTIPPKISFFPFYAVVIFTCWEGEAR